MRKSLKNEGVYMSRNQKPQVGLYLRLSREDHERQAESESIQSQRELVRTYTTQHQFEIKQEYVDDGYTGTNFNRPAFQQLLKDIDLGLINTVITKDLSRLGRNMGKVSYYIEEYFPQKGVRYIAINDGYDSFVESINNDMLGFKTVFNDYYCNDISKKVKSSLRTKKEQGLFTGWKAPYGYIRDPKDPHKLMIDPPAAVIVQKIFTMAYDGLSPYQIADQLSLEKIPNPSTYAKLPSKSKRKTTKLWCARTISEMLTNETYIGNLTQGRRKKINYKIKKEIRTNPDEWIIVPNTHEPLIKKGIFNVVQMTVDKNKRITNHTKIHLLTGLLFCKECGHAISITQSQDHKRSYCSCSYYRKYSKHHVCTPHTVNYQQLEQAVMEEVKALLKEKIDKNQLQMYLEKHNPRKQRYEKLQEESKQTQELLQKGNQALDDIYLDYKKQLIDQSRYESLTSRLKNEQRDLQHRQQKLEMTLLEQQENSTLRSFDQIVASFLKMNHPDRRLLIRLINRIELSENKQVNIYYNFTMDP